MGFYYWVDLWRFPFSQFTENVIVINFSCLFINLLFLLEFKFFGKLISSNAFSSPASFRYCIVPYLIQVLYRPLPHSGTVSGFCS